MNRMKPHLRRVPATDIRRGDLIYLASERGLCRVMNQFETKSIGDNSPMAVIDYNVVGYDIFAHSIHCMSAWKVVGWANELKAGLREWRDGQLASLLDDVRNYPSETVDGIKGV